MSPIREALVLPCLFLTVTLLGGLRLATDVRLVPPPLMALVLAVLLAGALVRSRTIHPEQLMNQRRSVLENLSGLVLLLTLFGASAQIFNLVTPDRGLLHVLVSVFFLVQLLTTLAAVRDRVSMLRSLVVLLGCAFILRFIALESLYAPGRGLMTRVMTALMEGVTLGALEYDPAGAATGYVAFLALALYLVGLLLSGSTPDTPVTSVVLAARATPTSMVAPLLLLPLLLAAACDEREAAPGGPPEEPLMSSAERDAILASARVWAPPRLPIASARLADNPDHPWSFRASDEVSCRFTLRPVGGTTTKFNCELPNGEIVKVKYGARNPELYAEVAATRLLTALGFGADRMYLVSRVRCYGCPALPFHALRCHARTGLATACFAGSPDYDRAVGFEPAVLEHRLGGRKVESVGNQGWAWYELDRIDPARGGSPRAHVDALRLIAVLLAHWDNKAENQRIVCSSGEDGGGATCGTGMVLMQDLGATFGPTKVDLPNWRHVPVWKDARSCLVSMKQLPFNGATFPDVRISEEGRTLLLSLLEQLTAAQLRDLFASSQISSLDAIGGEGRSAGAWADAFADKVRQVREAGPCQSAASLTASPAPTAGILPSR
jgi:hypothetical protein